ncbi:fatty acid desaturase family protein [Mycolicibacterium sarraceniae]|nr:fatty acid desaturase [Mycolicibacterium sarraceniae]
MAITDVADYAHLSPQEIDALGTALDAIRTEVEDSRGARDAAYIRRTIMFQRALDAGARLLIFGSRSRSGWAVGMVSLAVAKSIENMEISHNVVHGQWDWMNDPEIHSTTWEWDMAGVMSQWRYSHNYRHHVYANVVDLDDDLGFGIMRVTRDVPWRPRNLMQPLRNALLAVIFEWGIALHGLHSEHERAANAEERAASTKAFKAKIKRQVIKDYLLIPALNGPRWRRALTANVAANILRNLWAYTVIFCGHFPDGVSTFTREAVEQESKGEWYLRQMLGSANFTAGRVLAFMSGNLCYQIEHHLFPDLPSNRYAAIAPRVRALCDAHRLPYITGPLLRQFLQTQRTIWKLALPDRSATKVDARI